MTETTWGTDDWTDRLSEYLDDELDAVETAALREHLRSCIGCRATLGQLRAVQARAGSLPDREPDPAVWTGIAERIGAPGLTLDAIDDELATRRERKSLRFAWLRAGAAAAAVLALGIGIGRLSSRSTPPTLATRHVQAPAPGTPMTADAYRVAVAQHLGRTEALLTSFRAEAAGGAVDPQVAEWAGQMLTSTRLLLDSPAADDPKLKSLLEDLELVLAQISSLPRRTASSEHTESTEHTEHTEVDLARRAIDESRVLPRMRTLVPAGSPVTQGES